MIFYLVWVYIFINMKCEVITSEEDKRKEIFRIQVTPENLEENERILKSTGIEPSPEYVELKFNLKKRNK